MKFWKRPTEKSDETAKAIPLSKWQDPLLDVVLHFSETRCEVYFRCWDEDGNPLENTIGKLTFPGTWGVRSVRSEVCPHLDAIEGACILEVQNSLWPKEVHKYFYTDFAKQYLRDNARHFIVKGHDIFHEILAEGFQEEYLTDESPEFASVSKEL